MISSKWKFGRDDEVLSVRRSVSDSFDENDDKSMQLVMYEDDIPVGSASLYFSQGAYRIAHMCVVPELRKHYIGDLMIRLLIVRAFGMMAEKLCLKANEETVHFFEKYGFIITEGLEMEVTEKTVILNSKCGHDCSQCLNPCK